LFRYYVYVCVCAILPAKAIPEMTGGRKILLIHSLSVGWS